MHAGWSGLNEKGNVEHLGEFGLMKFKDLGYGAEFVVMDMEETCLVY